MSSLYVRNEFEQFLTDNSAESYIIDLSGEFDVLEDILNRYQVPRTSGWLGLTYLADEEVPQSLSATNDTGCYRELGSVQLHVVERASVGVAQKILPRADALQNLLRGQRINDIKILSVTPPNFERGITLDFEGGYTSATIIVGYERDNNL
jgi:hypothetical protein